MKLKGGVGLLYSKITTSRLFICLNFLSSLTITLLTLCSPVTFATPQGGVVVGNTATISSPAPGVTQIHQTADKSIINWQSYNVGSGERVNYQQPNSSSISLNRINPTNGPSSIYGTITANGQVWLVNPAGIAFGPGSYVNVGGLVATTANIRDQDFMAGQYRFSQSPEWNGSIINSGNIVVAKAGLVALVGNEVVNNGRIQANLGTVALASGNQFTIDFRGDQLISFGIGPQNSKPLRGVSNTGSIIANGGKVLMTAQSASAVLDNAINMSGVIEAKSVGVRKGEIILSADGKINVTGKMIATGKYRKQTGGTVKVLGKEIALKDNALIDVSGYSGGGTILIGGNAHGLGPEQNANSTVISPTSILKANAIKEGNGGKVVVWSNEETNYFGNIFARGGELSGDGGWVEVSGGNLGFYGAVDTTAPKGMIGSLLLDPRFLIVQIASGVAYSAGVNNLYANNIGATNILTPASIVAAAVGANITLQANTDVIIANALALATSGRTLTIGAGRSILINANVSTTNGAITLAANNNAATAADRSITSVGNPAGDTETVAGNITLANGVTVNSGTGAMSLTIGATVAAPFTPGSITQGATGGLTGGAITFSVPTTTAGSIGTLANPMRTTTTSNMTITSGSGGAYISNTGSFTLANPTLATNNPFSVTSSGVLTVPAGALSTGTGSINFESLGGNLATRNNLTTTSGDIRLAASGTLSVVDNLTTGTGTTNGITLIGNTGVTFNNNRTINAGSGTAAPGNISITTGASQTLTLGNNNRLLVGNVSGTAGKLTITSDLLSISASAQLGGTGVGTGFAQYAIIQPFSAAQTIGVGTGAGTLALSTTLLADIRTTNFRIGSNTGTGAMAITGWTPGANFNGGNLTLATGGNITQGSALNLSTRFSGLITRSGAGTGAVTLTQANTFSNIASSQNSGTGLVAISNTANTPLTVASLTDDLGTVNGMTAPGGVSLITSGTGLLSVNQGINTSGSNGNISLSSGAGGITQAASTTVRSGTGAISYLSSGGGVITLGASSLVLSGNASGTAGSVNFSADNMTINSAAQIGGTAAATGLASQVVLQPNTVATTIGINGGAGTLQLSGAELDTVYAKNLRIGNSTAGNMIINPAAGLWSPVSHVAQAGVLTLSTAGSITQGAGSVINLASSLASLLLRNASSVTLADSNIFSTIASAAVTGALSIKNASVSATTIGSLTDDIGTVNGVTATGGVSIQATLAGIVLNSIVSANAAGNAIVLAGTTFTNNVGAAALLPGIGRYLVWSGSPLLDNRNGLAFNFIQYNAVFGVSSVLGTGNGFLYTLAPVITPVLTGIVSKVYNQTTAATLVAGNYTTTGQIAGDTITLNNPVSGTYASQNVGTGINVSVSGISIASATNGAATVFGYTLGSTTANANIGEITALPLNFTGSRVYDGSTTFNAGVLNATNIISGDVVNLAGSATVASKNVNTYTSFITNSLLSSNTNYQVTGGTVSVDITPASLTITPTAAQSKVYGTDDPLAGFGYAQSGLVSGDSILGNLGRASGESVANYSYNLGSLTTDTPANYTISLVPDTFAITPASLTITANAGQNKGYGTSDTALGFTYGQSGLVNGVTPKYWDNTGTYVDASIINDTLTGNLGRNVGENVGNYNFVTGSLAASTPLNYILNLNSETFGITVANLIINADGANKIYGTNDPTLTYNTSGLVNGVTPKYWDASGLYVNASTINDTMGGTLTRAQYGTLAGEQVGNYAISQGTVNVSSPLNYNILFNTADLVINPATLNIYADAKSKVYGTLDPALTYNTTGLVNGVIVDGVLINDTMSGSLTRDPGQTVGNYAINQGTVDVSSPGNYNVIYNGNFLAITPASLTISGIFANNKLFNGTTPTTLNLVGAVLTGVIGIDNVTVNPAGYSANFITANIGNNIPVIVSSLGLTGADAFNYILVQPTGLTASILPNGSGQQTNVFAPDVSPIIEQGTILNADTDYTYEAKNNNIFGNIPDFDARFDTRIISIQSAAACVGSSGGNSWLIVNQSCVTY